MNFSTFIFSTLTGILLGCFLIASSEATEQRIPDLQLTRAGEQNIKTYEISPSGARLAIGYYDVVLVWDVKTRQPIHSFTIPNPPAASVAFSPDEKFLVIGSQGTVTQWELESGFEIRTWHTPTYYEFQGHFPPYAVSAMTFSNNGTQLVTLESGSTIQFWDWQNGEELFRFMTTHLSTHLEFLPDGIRLVEIAFGDVRIISSKTKEVLHEFSGAGGRLSADKKKLFIAVGKSDGRNGNILTIDVDTGKTLSTSRDFSVINSDLTISEDGSLVIVKNLDRDNTYL